LRDSAKGCFARECGRLACEIRNWAIDETRIAMNEQANLQTVQRFYQAVNNEDPAAILKLIADDLDWKDAGADKPWGAPAVHGREEYERYGKATFEGLG
jgi:SnoaL-like domain